MVESGTRQGCPRSPLLFALYMEPLAQRVRADVGIEGIPFGPDTHKITMYTDDVIFSLRDPVTSLPAVIQELERFGRVSGFKLNLDKSVIMNLSVPIMEQ